MLVSPQYRTCILFIFYIYNTYLRENCNDMGQSAGVRSIHTSEASQRLHAGDLSYAYLVGLFEGDDFFTNTKKGKYITYELVLNCLLKTLNLYIKLKIC